MSPARTRPTSVHIRPTITNTSTTTFPPFYSTSINKPAPDSTTAPVVKTTTNTTQNQRMTCLTVLYQCNLLPSLLSPAVFDTCGQKVSFDLFFAESDAPPPPPTFNFIDSGTSEQGPLVLYCVLLFPAEETNHLFHKIIESRHCCFCINNCVTMPSSF